MARVMPTISWDEACGRRMHRHGLLAPLPDIPTAVAAMCGAHAQIMTAAELSIGLRVDGVTRSDVARALWDDRSIVKTFGPRGTVHLLPATELPRWCAALSAVPRRTSMPQHVRLDDAQTDAVVAALHAALRDAELTVDELDEAVPQACGAWAGELTMPAFNGFWPRWRQVINVAAARGALCFGPNRGRRVTYTSPQRWLPGFVPDEDASIARDYLHAYGPAAPAHYAQWLAAPPTWAKAQFDQLELDEVRLGEEAAWTLAKDAAFAELPAGVRLLPYFDAFVVGSHPRRLLYPGRAAERALAGTQAGNFPVLLVDGVAAGVWHHRRAGNRIVLTVEPLRRLSARNRRALDDEASRVGTILEARVELTLGTVTVGPHA